MITEQHALLAAIAKDPGDDTPRLVYADWLEEHGDADRAEFIRGQIYYAHTKRGDPEREKFKQRADELLEKHRQEWLAGFDQIYPGMNLTEVQFERGFSHPELNLVANNACTTLTRAVTDNNQKAFNAVLARPESDINAINQSYTALHLAILFNRPEMFDALLARSDIDINKRVYSLGTTALCTAVYQNRPKMFSALLARPDIDVNAQNIEGFTALHFAVEYNQSKMFDALLADQRIDLTIPDNKGKTVMDFAQKSSNTYYKRRLNDRWWAERCLSRKAHNRVNPTGTEPSAERSP